jgi:hypothetical protein
MFAVPGAACGRESANEAGWEQQQQQQLQAISSKLHADHYFPCINDQFEQKRFCL